jgi:hypothetical protein
MKVFLSWSGDSSKSLALLFKDWLPSIINQVETFMSAEDIEKGERWSAHLAKELEDTKFGIIFLTPDNINAPWILFEAGALSKVVESSKVAPILHGLNHSDLKGPLIQFQATTISKEEISKLLLSINASLGDDTLEEKIILRSLDVWWPKLEADIKDVSVNKAKPDSKKEKLDSSIEEILINTRNSIKGNSEISEKIAEIIEFVKVAPPGSIMSPDHPVWTDLLESLELHRSAMLIAQDELRIHSPEEKEKAFRDLRRLDTVSEYIVRTLRIGRRGSHPIRRRAGSVAAHILATKEE